MPWRAPEQDLATDLAAIERIDRQQVHYAPEDVDKKEVVHQDTQVGDRDRLAIAKRCEECKAEAVSRKEDARDDNRRKSKARRRAGGCHGDLARRVKTGRI